MNAPLRWRSILVAYFACLATAVAAQESPEQLVRKLGSPNFEEREQAVKDLIALGEPALKPLRKALESKDPEVVRKAEECIPIIQQTIRIAALLKNLQEKNVHIRIQAARELGDQGAAAEGAVSALAEALRDENDLARPWMIMALGSIGPKAVKATPSLIELLKGPKGYENWHFMAARALGKIGPGAQDAVPALLERIESEDPLEPLTKPHLRDSDFLVFRGNSGSSWCVESAFRFTRNMKDAIIPGGN